MQKRLITLLTTLSFTITGCGSIKNEKAIHSIMNDESDVIEVKAETVEYMFKEKYSFSILMYSNNCSYCEKAVGNLKSIKDELNYSLYQIEMYTASIEYHSDKLPNYYNVNDSCPFLYVIKEGEVSYKSKIEDLTNYTNLKKMIKTYSIDSNITTLTGLGSYQKYVKNHEEFLLYTYDSSLLDEKDIYFSYLYSKAINANKNLLIVDKKTAKSELIAKINEEYGDGFDILSLYSQGKIKTTLRYYSASGSEIESFIVSCF